MSFYSNLAAVASKLLSSKGKLLTFTRKTSTTFSPEEGKRTTSTSTYTGYGAAFNYDLRKTSGEAVVDGSIKLLLENTTTVPILGDTVVIDSRIYKMVSIKPTSPAGEVVIYTIMLE